MIDVEMHMRMHHLISILTALVTIYITSTKRVGSGRISFDKQKHGNDVVIDAIPNFSIRYDGFDAKRHSFPSHDNNV